MLRALRRSRREDGAVAVEAALVIPLLCLLVFGMIEFAFVMRDYASVSSMVRTGARIASTGADHGPGDCDTDPAAPPCAPASTPALAQEAADAVQRSGAISNPGMINYILVYKANNQGYPGPDGNTTMPSSCAGYSNCVMYKWRTNIGRFRYASGSWASTSISACFPGSTGHPMDRVGVYMDATHTMMTGLFGTSIGMHDHAVMDFEPLPTQSCGASEHQ
jgi:TadE-like protein